MKNNYYTPSIEEFLVGFEFEMNSASKENTWLSCILYGLTDSIFNVKYGADGIIETTEVPDCIRVKYLDKEDIESLGFGDYIAPREYNHTWSKGSVILKCWFNNKTPYIRIQSKNSIYNGTLFMGEIKNKSELKVLLTQLGIN